MWQDVQGWCVWRAKEGTARALGTNPAQAVSASIHAMAILVSARGLRQQAMRSESMASSLPWAPGQRRIERHEASPGHAGCR
jgi:hypothetical protein